MIGAMIWRLNMMLGGHLALVSIAAAVLLLLVCNYKKVPPNTALVISGCIRRHYKVKDADGNITKKKFGYRIVRGGATIVIPFLERASGWFSGWQDVNITARGVTTQLHGIWKVASILIAMPEKRFSEN